MRDLKLRSPTVRGTADSGTALDESPAASLPCQRRGAAEARRGQRVVASAADLAHQRDEPVAPLPLERTVTRRHVGRVVRDLAALCATRGKGAVASSSELSQMCRIGERSMSENYTAEDVKFTPSAAIPLVGLASLEVDADADRYVCRGLRVVRVDRNVLRLDEELAELNAARRRPSARADRRRCPPCCRTTDASTRVACSLPPVTICAGRSVVRYGVKSENQSRPPPPST